MPLPTRRDPEDLRRSLEDWFRRRLGDSTRVGAISIPEGTGMSSETLLFDLDRFDLDSAGTTERLVARLRPNMDDWPLFPTYDLARQAAAMRLVAANSDVPVPDVRFVENDEGAIGVPFIVMGRIDGKALPDLPPYTFGGSFFDDLAPGQRRHYQRNFMSVLVRLHQIDLTAHDTSFAALPSDGDALDRQLADLRDYAEWARGDREIPLIDEAIDWLVANRPVNPSPTVLNWGDARPANMLVDGVTPAGVLDWEMVDLGPPEVDIAWTIFMHAFFQHVASIFELPGFPDLFQPDDVAADYVAAGGAAPADLDWYVMLASARFAIISVRSSSREAAYGNREVPDDHADLIMHRALLEEQLADRR